jgi:hypothetical protein
MKAADEFKDKTTAPNQLWQTDFTYLKVIGWGWYYLSTVLDDFSRYIIAWKLCTTMKAEDVTDTLELALQASGIDTACVLHRPRLLSDNGSSYLSANLAEWLDDRKMQHVRGAPYHPMTQGKIERWHQTLKNRILLENYYLPGDLNAHIDRFVEHYNHRRYHESLQNLTPADVYFGRGQTILLQRERTKPAWAWLRDNRAPTLAAFKSQFDVYYPSDHYSGRFDRQSNERHRSWVVISKSKYRRDVDIFILAGIFRGTSASRGD